MKLICLKTFNIIVKFSYGIFYAWFTYTTNDKKYFEIEMEMKGTREFLRPSTQKIE